MLGSVSDEGVMGVHEGVDHKQGEETEQKNADHGQSRFFPSPGGCQAIVKNKGQERPDDEADNFFGISAEGCPIDRFISDET